MMVDKGAGSELRIWHLLQALVFVVGIVIVAALLFAPTLGLHLLWDVLIPAAPLLFVLIPGFWRNVCPVSTVGMLAQRLGRSKQRELPLKAAPWVAFGGVVLLYVAVPLRHAIFDLDALASAIFLLVAAALAFSLGRVFAWKSGWCAGLCPVRPVEALYGFRPAARFVNAHCGSCANCSVPCPDSTAESSLHERSGSRLQSLADIIMVGGFVGFIWGWFHVADYSGFEGWSNLAEIYRWPFAAAAATSALYLGCLMAMPRAAHSAIRRLFACAAVSCYYWYRLPMLMGFGLFPGDGMLIDLSDTLPLWLPQVLPYLTTSFFLWWMVWRAQPSSAWLVRPEMLPHSERIRV